jgi:translation elongation factor EF-Tu-like GTPase
LSWSIEPNPDALQQFFKVGGIGSVVIGRVEAGEIKRGMKLVAAPGVAPTLAARTIFLFLARATPVSKKQRYIAIARST